VALALQRELPKDKWHVVAPAGVVVGVDVKDGGEETPYVLHDNGLCVQIDNGGGLMR
jgi:hypothetical protein